MSLINQNIRYSSRDNTNTSNPESLFSFVKPSRIIHGEGAPSNTIGEVEWYYIDSLTGDLYYKDGAGWAYTGYSFGSGGGGGNISDAANVGTGIGIYAGLNIALDTILLKSLISSTTKLTFTSLANEVDIGININKSDVGLSLVDNVKNTQDFTAFSPSAANDITEGYTVGSLWVQTDPSLKLWICADNTAGAAVWLEYDTATPSAAKGYLASRFNSSFNIILNGQTPGIIYQIPHSTDFDFYDTNNWTVNYATNVAFFQFSGQAGTKFQASLNVDLQISATSPSLIDFDFAIYDNTLSVVVPNSSKNFKIASNSNFGASGYSSIFTPDAGHAYSIVFTFYVPYNFTLNIQNISFVLNEI